MKFLLVLVGLVGLSLADLDRDLEEIRKLIPMEKIKKMAQERLEKDPEFQSVVGNLKGAKWAKLKSEIDNKPEIKKFFDYMIKAGVEKKAKEIPDNIARAAVGGGRGSTDKFQEEVLAEIDVTKIVKKLVQDNAVPDLIRLAIQLIGFGFDTKKVGETIASMIKFD